MGRHELHPSKHKFSCEVDSGVCNAARVASHVLLAPSPPLVQARRVYPALGLPATAHPDGTSEKGQRVAGSAEPGLTQELIVAVRVCRRSEDEA